MAAKKAEQMYDPELGPSSFAYTAGIDAQGQPLPIQASTSGMTSDAEVYMRKDGGTKLTNDLGFADTGPDQGNQNIDDVENINFDNSPDNTIKDVDTVAFSSRVPGGKIKGVGSVDFANDGLIDFGDDGEIKDLSTLDFDTGGDITGLETLTFDANANTKITNIDNITFTTGGGIGNIDKITFSTGGEIDNINKIAFTNGGTIANVDSITFSNNLKFAGILYQNVTGQGEFAIGDMVTNNSTDGSEVQKVVIKENGVSINPKTTTHFCTLSGMRVNDGNSNSNRACNLTVFSDQIYRLQAYYTLKCAVLCFRFSK
jgi:hypothetical protein